MQMLGHPHPALKQITRSWGFLMSHSRPLPEELCSRGSMPQGLRASCSVLHLLLLAAAWQARPSWEAAGLLPDDSSCILARPSRAARVAWGGAAAAMPCLPPVQRRAGAMLQSA
jgi:hypothetical protein